MAISLNQLRLTISACLLAPAFALAADLPGARPSASPGPYGELPAVSAPNGKFSLEGGFGGARGVQTRGLGLASGSFTFPLGQRFGAQFDATAGSVADRFAGGAGAHLFYRNPATFLVGATAGATFGRFGGEAEVYASNFLTLHGAAGYQTRATSASAIVNSGAFGNLGATIYPDPNLAISGGVTRNPDAWGGYAGLEYQPEAWKNISLFVNGAAAERRQFAVTAGVQVYFGADKTLIRRHREDDPPNMMTGPGSLITGAALAALQQEWLRTVAGSSLSSNGVCPAGKFYEPVIKLCL